MKRLITILLSFIGCVSLMGQTPAVPMVVAGKMYVDGTIRSQGAVHVYTSVDTGKINIANSGANTQLVTDEIIFYSNDHVDGLLMNQSVDGGVKGLNSVAPAKVIFRKSVENRKYTYFSLPFPVAEDSVYQGGTTNQLLGGEAVENVPRDYYAVEFNAQVRSDSSTVNKDKAFTEIDYSAGFKQATGYAVYFNGTAGERSTMDFVTENTGAISELFRISNRPPDEHTVDNGKKVNFTIYGTDEDWKNREYGDGWAFIGGLSSSTFNISSASVKYDGTAIWYRMAKTSQAIGTTHETADNEDETKYQTVLLADESVNIGPYTPFYIQVDAEKGVANPNGAFVYYSDGTLSLESIKYRSSDNTKKDHLYFALSSNKNNAFDRFYVTFADNYSEGYKASEDAITMNTFSTNAPAVWSLQDGTNKELALNGLPMKDEREIRMGFSVPEAGDYTLNLNALRLTDVRNVILADNMTGREVDLLQTPYSFNTDGAVKQENDRFILRINSSYTDIPVITADKPYAFAKDNLLTIKNLAEGDKVTVYDLAGRTIVSSRATGKEFSTVLSQKGVYVVNVKGGQTSVLKVLNK